MSLVAHGDHTNLLIENNVIWEDLGAVDGGCWGIAADHTTNVDKVEQFPGLAIRDNTIINVGNLGIGCAVCPDAIIENNTLVHQSVEFKNQAIKVPNKEENSYFPVKPNTNNVTISNNTVLHDSLSKGVGVLLGDGDGSGYTSTGNKTYYDPGSAMVAGCETYNATDVVNVSNPVCKNSIPQDLLDAALAKTDIEIPETLGTGTGTNIVAGSGGGTMGWFYLGIMLLLFGYKSGFNYWFPRTAVKNSLDPLV